VLSNEQWFILAGVIGLAVSIVIRLAMKKLPAENRPGCGRLLADYVAGVFMLTILIMLILAFLNSREIITLVDEERSQMVSGLEGFRVMGFVVLLSMLLTPVWMWRFYRPQRKPKYTEH
jgi:hypothetical protein